ncbi:arylsulfatase [Acidobacteria bacterium AH-259-O06]|nr:arylsulfatase [Acidobacteria bacterium AH-259-O06]
MRTISCGILVAAVLCLAACSGQQAGDAGERPNVILVMTDDQGYGDFGFMGNPVIKTPNLDAMSERSAMMERFYVSPVCAPTRANLMTGRYNYRTRVIDTYIGRAMMEPEEVTMAELLGDAGYGTGIFGKWHLGDSYPLRPQDQGFQEVLVHRGGGIGQPSDPPGGEGKYTDPILFHNGEKKQMNGYCTDIYFDAAMDFLDKNQQAGKPSFIYLPTNAPHGPFHDVPEDLYKAYMETDLRQVMVGEATDEQYEKFRDQTARKFAMIENVDQNMGRLFERLKANGAYENTLVMFLVDNGPAAVRYVRELRGAKGGVNEGGIRTPFLAHWPAQLTAGVTSDRVAAHYDVLPTVLEATGTAKPADLQLDGRSFFPLLKGQEVSWPDRTIYVQWHRGDVPVRYRKFAAVEQQYKLLHPDFNSETPPAEPAFELYDLQDDPGEKNNLAVTKPEIVARMQGEYDAWFDNVGSTRPDNYAPPRIQIGTPHEELTVLTRQDWRMVHGENWSKGALGNWLVRFAAAGNYDMRILFKPAAAAGKLDVKIGGYEKSVPVRTGDTEITLSAATLEAGDTEVNAALTLAGKTEGVHQVYIGKT